MECRDPAHGGGTSRKGGESVHGVISLVGGRLVTTGKRANRRERFNAGFPEVVTPVADQGKELKVSKGFRPGDLPVYPAISRGDCIGTRRSDP